MNIYAKSPEDARMTAKHLSTKYGQQVEGQYPNLIPDRSRMIFVPAGQFLASSFSSVLALIWLATVLQLLAMMFDMTLRNLAVSTVFFDFQPMKKVLLVTML